MPPDEEKPVDEENFQDLSNNSTPGNQDEQPFSIFTPYQKSLISYACALYAMFSTISSFIYFPAITAIARSLTVSIQAVNFTITSYLIVSAIAPSIFGSMADQLGRRPVILMTLTLYVGANVGLALANQYSALVVLRSLQAAGASSSIAISYGIIADISEPAERGSYVAFILGFTNAAPALGPVIGGVVAEKLSWRWIFWLLAIVSGTHLICLIVFFPETLRRIVGNGSVRPRNWVNKSLYPTISRHDTPPTSSMEGRTKFKFDMLGPFKSVTCLRSPANLIIVIVNGITYTICACLAASLSAQVIKSYSLNYLTAGLAYLPSAVGGLMASFVMGKLLNHNYRVAARTLGNVSTDMENFPIERARLRWVIPFAILFFVTTLAYGWALQAKAHLAAVLVPQYFSGAMAVCLFMSCSTLMTDLNPGKSATAQAGNNLVRCALSAAGLAALEAMIRGIGVGWCFTVFGVFSMLCVPLLYALMRKGKAWRETAKAVGLRSDGKP